MTRYGASAMPHTRRLARATMCMTMCRVTSVARHPRHGAAMHALHFQFRRRIPRCASTSCECQRQYTRTRNDSASLTARRKAAAEAGERPATRASRLSAATAPCLAQCRLRHLSPRERLTLKDG
eukprot:4819042-Prymnesium_polylepis.1